MNITNPTDSSTIQYIIPRLNDLYYNYNANTPVLSDSFSVVGSVNYSDTQYVLAYTYNGKDYFRGSLSSDLNSLAFISNIDFNGSQWIAVGGTYEGSGATLALSSDGINWVAPISNQLPYGIIDLAWGNKTWVAIGSDGNGIYNFPNRIQYSYDGLNWNLLGGNPLSVNSWNEIVITSISHNGQYFLISFFDSHDYGGGNVNRAYVAKSTDGATWTNKTNITGVFPALGGESFFNSLISLAWNGRIWVGMNAGSTYPIGYSSDGINWSRAAFPVISIGVSVAYNGTRFLAASGNGADPYYLVTSTDGNSWSGILSPLTNITDITWNGTYWIVSNNYTGNNPVIAYSSDLVTWNTSNSAEDLFSEVGTTAVTSRNKKNFYITYA